MSTTSPCCWCDPLPCRQALDRSQSQSKLRCSPCIGKKLATDPGILLSFLPSEKPQKRRKRSHTNVSNTLVARPSTPPAQTPQRSFRGTAAGTHLPSPTGSHTAAHTVKQGAFLPRPQRGLVLPAKLILFHRAFIYIHFSVLCEPSTPAEEKNPAKLPP